MFEECETYQVQLFKKLEKEIKEKIPFSRGSLTCFKEVVAHSVFDLDKGSIDVISNFGINLVEGEIKTTKENYRKVKSEIEGIKTVGAWGYVARGCKVVEVHRHGDIYHVHFKCSLFLDSDQLVDVVKQIVKIVEKYGA